MRVGIKGMVAERSGLKCIRSDKAIVIVNTIRLQTKPLVFCDVLKKIGLGNSSIAFQCP